MAAPGLRPLVSLEGPVQSHCPLKVSQEESNGLVAGDNQ